jgi:hypothetical protein
VLDGEIHYSENVLKGLGKIKSPLDRLNLKKEDEK